MNILKASNFKHMLCLCAFACFSQISAMPYIDTWIDSRAVSSNPVMFSFHRSAAEDVAKAQRFCSDKSSNIAAFAISAHSSDGAVIGTALLPYVVSSGDQKASDSGISTVLVKEMFLKSYDGILPLDAEIQFISFVRKINGYSELEELEKALTVRKQHVSNVLAIPDLTFSSKKEDQAKDKLLGSILHCEQAIMAKSVLSRQFIASWIGENFRTCTFGEGTFLSFDIITYNDMCPKCFSTCLNAREVLGESVNAILKEKYKTKTLPLKIFISSFRPYAIDSERHTRYCKQCNGKKKICADYMSFYDHITEYKGDLNAPILQFFNPWITSCVTSFEVIDFIDAILKNKISIGESKVPADHENVLRCVNFSRGPACTPGLTEAARSKIEEYRARLIAMAEMVNEVAKSLL